MLLKIALLFAIVPLIEISLIFILAHFLGWGWTILLTVISSLLGAYLAKLSSRHWWLIVREEWGREGFPLHRLGEGALLVMAMAFLITPGPLTGILGLIFLIPKVRDVGARFIVRRISKRVLNRFWR